MRELIRKLVYVLAYVVVTPLWTPVLLVILVLLPMFMLGQLSQWLSDYAKPPCNWLTRLADHAQRKLYRKFWLHGLRRVFQ